MTSKKIGCFVLWLVLTMSVSAFGQNAKDPPVSKVFAVLEKAIDTKTSVIGDDVTLTTVNDVVVDNQIVIPRGSSLVGHVAGVLTKGKDQPKSVLAIRIDKAVTVAKQEIALQAIIAAIAAPPAALTNDPTYEMMHSNEPKMVGSPRAASASGTLSASSQASSNAAVATAQIKGRMEQGWLLNENSQGASGFEDVSIAWHLALPPPLTVFSTKARSLKLTTGTQMLLRMAEPRVPR